MTILQMMDRTIAILGLVWLARIMFALEDIAKLMKCWNSNEALNMRDVDRGKVYAQHLGEKLR